MAKRTMIGLGAAGALAAAATGVTVMRNQKSPVEMPATLRAKATVCVESNFPLVDGMMRGCFTPAQFEALRDRPVVGGDRAPTEVNLAGRNVGERANVARTCAEYDAMIAEGWYALSGADMRREEYFKRSCGALSMLVDARPARSSHFTDGRADEADVRSLARAQTFSLGEASADPAEVLRVEAGVWKLATAESETIVYEIAHADFTGDGLGEILAYVSTGAVAGTARGGAIGLMEKPSAGGPCAFSPR